jgi:hypothetical protein
VIGLLALAWAVVLVPSLVRPKFESSPIDGVRNFERSMGILASTRYGKQQIPGRWVMVPKDLPQAPRRRRNRLIRKRRQNFLRLVVAALGTLTLGLIPGLHAILYAHLAVDVVLVGYIVQLRRWHRAEMKVVPLPTAREDVAPHRDVSASS